MAMHASGRALQAPAPLPQLEPVTLAGQWVRLVPLALEHATGLAEAAVDGEIWRLWYTAVPEPDAMSEDIERRLRLQKAGSMLPFTVIDASTGYVVGMTAYMNIDAAGHRLEIGSTWYAKRVHRTGLNTEAKLLLLRHAFEQIGCMAVELRTHWMNHQSRRAIERLGAKLDGILRNHQFAKDGSVRDTCVYSILNTEWPAVQANLQWQLERPR